MSGYVAFLLTLAVRLTGYGMPAELPQIVVHDPAFIQDLACGAHSCAARAFTVGTTIHVDRALDPERPLGRALLLHEMVHVLQNAWRGRARDCRDRIQREREAFLVQAAYLERFGVHDFNVAAALQRYPCQGESK